MECFFKQIVLLFIILFNTLIVSIFSVKMKKLFTTAQYKLQHKRKLLKFKKRRTKKRLSVNSKIIGTVKRKYFNDIKPPIIAPNDLRLIENTQECLLFLEILEAKIFLSQRKNIKYIIISLKDVTEIDYGAISILTAISEDLKSKRIILQGDFPNDENCKKFIIESGLLNSMIDEWGKNFQKRKNLNDIFEKGCGILSDDDNKKISQLVKNVVAHLTGISKYCLPVKSIILEICGNSIEWSGTQNKQWLLGVKYENGKVIFTATDLGKGILDTLYRRFSSKLGDIFTLKTREC